jgi:hypothetical protein
VLAAITPLLLLPAGGCDHSIQSRNNRNGIIMNTIKSLDEALNRKVRCTDGSLRLLTHYDNRLGYYQRPIGGGVWMDIGGVNLPACRRLFIGGTIADTTTTQAP